MTDTTETTTTEDSPEPLEATTQAPETPETAEPAQDAQEDAKGGKEAAKYRLRLREAEAERDGLAAQVDALRDTVLTTALAEAVAITPKFGQGNVAVDPATMQPRPVDKVLNHAGDLFTIGQVDRASLFDPSGALDRGRLAEELTRLHGERPDLFTTPTGAVASIGQQPTITGDPTGDKFTAAFARSGSGSR